MKHLVHVLFMAVSVFVFSGCFELIEEISLNDDGSGSIEVTLNLSQSKSNLKSIMLMDSINNYKVPSEIEIRNHINTITAEVKKINGVSNVSKKMDFNEFIFSVSCDFTDVDVLNKVIAHFSSDAEARKALTQKQFDYNKTGKQFKRTYHYDLGEAVTKARKKDRKVLDGAEVTTIYRFQSPIATATNDQAKISGSRKAIMLKVDVNDMINETNSIKNTIQLK